MNESQVFDVIIIGAGIVGTAIARELSKYELKVVLVEKNSRIAQETSAGNSGVVHGGFDPVPGTLKATLNIEGRHLYENEWFRDLRFPHEKVDSLVLAFDDAEEEELRHLYDQGIANGIPADQLEIVNQGRCLELEPNVNPAVVAALLCTCSFVVDPVSLANTLAANAIRNGTTLWLSHSVTGITRLKNEFDIKTRTNGAHTENLRGRLIINAAGHFADVIARMINDESIQIKARRGQYRILEKTERSTIRNHILFMTPTVHGKGVIVAPMLDGHVLVGPTAEDGVAKEDARLVTIEKFEEIGNIGRKIIPGLRMDRTSGVIAGSRSICTRTNDFVIGSSEIDSGMIHVAGISSPGLSAAPAIAREVIRLVGEKIELKKRADYEGRQPEIDSSTMIF